LNSNGGVWDEGDALWGSSGWIGIRRPTFKILLSGAVVLASGGALSVATASAASASSSPVTIALVCSCTGEAGPEYLGAQGAFLARIDQQNAVGGVDGHHIKTLIIDDQTSPSLDTTAVQSAVSKGVTASSP